MFLRNFYVQLQFYMVSESREPQSEYSEQLRCATLRLISLVFVLEKKRIVLTQRRWQSMFKKQTFCFFVIIRAKGTCISELKFQYFGTSLLLLSRVKVIYENISTS
jgi:hypothetical protein